jgi:4-amino-4-deoxy-L-arabinose transferase-like glycosyltransferase
MTNTRLALASTTLILLFAFSFRLAGIQQQSIWFDEGWSAYAAVQPTLLDAARADLTNPPLYYMLLHATARFFGDTAFALRWVSLLLCLLTIAISYRIAAESFDRKTAIIVSLLTSFSALLWWASQEARMYTLLALLVSIAALSWHRLLSQAKVTDWLLLWGAELALLYAHNTAPIAVIWLNAVTVIYWLSKRSFSAPDWRVWFGGQFAILLAWLPWLTIFTQLTEANSAVTTAPVLSLQLFWDVWQAFIIGIWSLVNEQPVLSVFCAVLIIIFIVLPDWRRATNRWFVLHSLLLTTGIIAGLMILQNELHARYLAMIVPLLFIPLAQGISRLRPVLSVMTASIMIFLFQVVFFYAQNPLYQHDDVRGMVQHYASNLTAEDAVIAWSYADRYDLAYYWERLSVQTARITLPEGADREAVLPLIPAVQGISLNVWYTQRADFRGMMPCLLEHGSHNQPVEFTTYGMTNLHFQPVTHIAPRMITTDIQFNQATTPLARLIAHGTLPANFASDHALCLPLEIELLAEVNAPLKAALIARNLLGWEIARADAVFALADQRTTDQVTARQTLTAYPLIRLPYGSPQSEYAIYLRLYDERNNSSGLEPVTPSGTSSGRDVLIGIWQPGANANWEESNQESALPIAANQAIVNDWTLLGTNLASENTSLQNGAIIRASLLWQGTGELPPLLLQGDAERWQIEVPPLIVASDEITLDWREIRIPANAETGGATLTLPDGSLLARYNIESLPILTEPPDIDQEIEVVFPGVGTLTGFSVPSPVTDPTQPLIVTLSWRAGNDTLPIDYTVFVQLLNSEGIVIAQSDAQPAENTRPTSGWRAGEFILDPHTLRFNSNAASGSARLIVGLYNAQDNSRVRLETGQNFVEIPFDLTVR